jgi:hypothetical protein
LLEVSGEMSSIADYPDWQRLDWQILRDTSVSLYHDGQILDDDISWLKNHGYHVRDIDVVSCKTYADVFSLIRHGYGLHAFYSDNISSFDDSLNFVNITSSVGLVWVIRNFQVIDQINENLAQWILESVAIKARTLLVLGHRLLLCIQTDDPRRWFAPVGATPVLWNPKERQRSLLQGDDWRRRTGQS